MLTLPDLSWEYLLLTAQIQEGGEKENWRATLEAPLLDSGLGTGTQLQRLLIDVLLCPLPNALARSLGITEQESFRQGCTGLFPAHPVCPYSKSKQAVCRSRSSLAAAAWTFLQPHLCSGEWSLPGAYLPAPGGQQHHSSSFCPALPSSVSHGRRWCPKPPAWGHEEHTSRFSDGQIVFSVPHQNLCKDRKWTHITYDIYTYTYRDFVPPLYYSVWQR